MFYTLDPTYCRLYNMCNAYVYVIYSILYTLYAIQYYTVRTIPYSTII